LNTSASFSTSHSSPFVCEASLFHIPGTPRSLLADACLKTEHPENCRHKMSEIPRWISSQKVEIVRTMLSDDPVCDLRIQSLELLIPLPSLQTTFLEVSFFGRAF
jgi:hypothetical protein